MPAYQNAPFRNPVLLQKGVPVYLYGSFSQQVGDSKLAVTNVALATNVATVTVQQITGPAVIVGDYISIINTTSTTGLFNVNRAIITAVSIDSSTGAGTITFALTHADVGSVANSGTAVVEPAEVGETLANGSSIACLVQAPEGDSQFTLPVAVTFPSLPTTATIVLQAAIKNLDAEYTTLGTVATVAAGVETVGPFGQVQLQRGYCYRFNASSVTGGTLPTIVAKIG